MHGAQVSVTDASTVSTAPFSYISIQALGGLDHEHWPNGHLPGIDSAGLYPAMSYANALPPTRYTGYEDPPHLTIVSARSQASCPLCCNC
jgi:hypothetical protein